MESKKQNIALAKDFLSKLQTEDKIITAAFADKKSAGGGMGYHGWHTTMSIDKAWSQIQAANNQGCGIFFAVNHLEPKLDSNPNHKRTKKMVVGCRAIWCEDDNAVDEGCGPRSEWPIEPSIIVESSAGKYHYYWITSTQDKDEWESVMIKMVTAWGSDPNARDLCRVLRLPGTFHMKKWVREADVGGAGESDGRWMVQVVGGCGKKYEWEKIVRLFGKAGEADLISFRKIERAKIDGKIAKEEKRVEGIRGAEAGDGVSEGRKLRLDDGTRDYVKEIETGVNYHGAFAGLSMRLVNLGKKDDEIKLSLENAFLRGMINPRVGEGRKSDLNREWIDVDRTVQTARQKWSDEEGARDTDVLDQMNELEKMGTGIEVTNRMELLDPPGRMGEFVRDIYSSMRDVHKIIPAPTALSVVAGIAGRAFNISGGGLNIYTSILMPTGYGKEFIDHYVTRTMQEVLMLEDSFDIFMGASRYTGPKALLKELHKKKCMISVFTEAGLLFGSQAGDNVGLLRAILSLYTKSGRDAIYKAEMYSQDEDSVQSINSPAFTLINESTPETFETELKKRDSMTTGELPRMTILKVERGIARKNPEAEYVLRESVQAKLSTIADWCFTSKESPSAKGGSGNNSSHGVIKIEVPEWYHEFDRMCAEKREENYDTNQLKSSMYTRSAHKALKHAGLVAIMNSEGAIGVDNPPVITKEIWDWAIHYHEYEMWNLRYLFGDSQDDLLDMACDHIGGWIVYTIRLMYGLVKGKKPGGCHKGKEVDMMKAGVFKYSTIHNAKKNTKAVKKLGDNLNFVRSPKNGVRKMVDSMVDHGMLVRVPSKKMQDRYDLPMSSNRAEYYRITDEFSTYMRSHLQTSAVAGEVIDDILSSPI